MTPEQQGRRAHKILEVIHAGTVYNVDWQEAKDLCNRMVEDTLRPIWHKHLDGVERNGNGYPKYDYTTYWKHPYANQLPGYIKAAQKDLAKAEKQGDAHGAATLKKLIEAAQTLNDQFAVPLLAKKAQVVMGRRPSTDASDSDRRSLENTGTCGICGKNVKLEGEGLYHHGFTLRWGSRNGSCFGRGYKPIEVSSDVLVDYIHKVLKPYIKTQQEQAKNLSDTHAKGELTKIASHFRTDGHRGGIPIPLVVERGHHLFGQIVEEEVQHHESNAKSAQRELAMREQQLREWQPRPLPGCKK